MGLWTKKPVDAAEPESERLHRSLTVTDLTALGIGAVIGAGIFSSTGTAAAGGGDHIGAGPALVISYVLTAVACGFAALCYAEFAALIPVSGSAYTYAYVTLGEMVAWIIGWDLVLEYGVGNVAVAVSWSDYFQSFLAGLGVHWPTWLGTTIERARETPGLLDQVPHVAGIPIVLNLPAALIVALITIVLVIGIKESARVNSVIVALKIVLVLGFIGIGAFYVTPSNWTPFSPNGFRGIMTGASLIFFSYIGFDAVSTTAEEAKNPQRDLPRGMMYTLIICTALYVAVTIVLTGLVKYTELAVGDPLALALNRSGLEKLSGIFSFGAVIAMTAVLLVFQLGQPRIFMSMARDGLLPPWAARVHPRFRTPHITTILCGVVVGICSLFIDINTAVEFTNIGTLFAFAVVSIGVIVLRYTNPGARRPFRTPWVPFVPIVSALSCVALMAYLPLITWIRFFVWLAVGMVIYFAYGRRHSRWNRS